MVLRPRASSAGRPKQEAQLSSLFGALVEEASLAKRMQHGLAAKESAEVATGLASRADELNREATQVSEWLHALTNLVEPEPS
jgi:two-component system chemotaxis response regulator CheB